MSATSVNCCRVTATPSRSLDSFVHTGTGGNKGGTRYVLVFERARGSVADLFRQTPLPWSQTHAVSQVRKLLGVLDVLHQQGALHRDITPWNILDTEGGLKLADFGIALHDPPGIGVTPLFNAWWASMGNLLGKKSHWKVEDDLFQVGQILALLLDDPARRDEGLRPIPAREVKDLSCDPEIKSVIYRALQPRQFPYASAGDMNHALAHAPQIPWGRMAAVRGKRIVLTGPMEKVRRELKADIRRAGGTVQDRVSRHTDYVVFGREAPAFVAENLGTKLLRRHRFC